MKESNQGFFFFFFFLLFFWSTHDALFCFVFFLLIFFGWLLNWPLALWLLTGFPQKKCCWADKLVLKHSTARTWTSPRSNSGQFGQQSVVHLFFSLFIGPFSSNIFCWPFSFKLLNRQSLSQGLLFPWNVFLFILSFVFFSFFYWIFHDLKTKRMALCAPGILLSVSTQNALDCLYGISWNAFWPMPSVTPYHFIWNCDVAEYDKPWDHSPFY